MPAFEREGSRDRDAVVRQQHSFDSGRASVPMWDSSDPERAPPPLPLNPSNGSPTTKANTSAGIAAAVKQIVEKARESAPISSYTANQTPQTSPERSLIRGAHHKRMQSLQTGSAKDLRSYLESNRSPERSPERPTSRSSAAPYSRATSIDDFSPTPERSTTPTPATKDPLKDTPTLRPTTRPPPRPLLGENTPPSATMLALQTMQVPDLPLNDVTNGLSTPTGARVHTNYDFSSQLLNLTTIATNLQKEMSQLSRRSKDNATDLISLKEATNSRDEDIRKSLRELATSVNSTQNLLGAPPAPRSVDRNSSTLGSAHFLDTKPFSSPPSASKSYSLPRAASAQSFLDEPRCASPSPFSMEGVASVAMLEKIIREMVTKEGQDRLQTTLSELLEKSRKENVAAARKVEQLSEFIKDKSESHALVPVRNTESGAPQLDLNFDTPRSASNSGYAKSPVSTSVANDEVIKLLQRIKDSVAHSGGTAAEVKGLVRDLRGEVLGMGRELGKKLDHIGNSQLTSTLDRSIADGQGSEHAEEVQRIVEDGIAELKQQMASMMRERAEQGDSALQQLVTARSGPDGDQMLAVVKHALNEHSFSIEKNEDELVGSGLDRDGVLDAVKEGLKDFEPNIELQQFGLERDEILAVLKEGLQDYQNNRPEPIAPSIDKGEIFEVMQEAMKDFQTPFPSEQIAQMKEDLLCDVRQALEQHQHQHSSTNPTDHEAMHAAVLAAVGEGLANHGPAPAREIEISREDLFDAVKAGLDGSSIPFGGFGEQVLSQLHELIENMRLEFKQYSSANGRDTEQVLDAVNDGLEKLRAEVESYVDRAQDVTGKDEIVDTIKGGLEQLRGDVQIYCAQGPSNDNGRAEMLDYIRAEFEQLHESTGNRDRGLEMPGSGSSRSAEMLLAIRECMDVVQAHTQTRSDDKTSMEDLDEAIKAELEQLKTAILHANAVDKGELIETIQDSLGALHAKFSGSDISGLSGGSAEEVVQAMHGELATLKESIHEMISNVERDSGLTGVQQSIENLRVQLSADQNEASAEALGAIKEELDHFKESMSSAMVIGSSSNHGDALEALRIGLDQVKETASRSVGDGISDEQLEAIRGEFENLRNSIASNMHGGSNEEVLDALRLGLDDLRSHLEKKLENPDVAMSHQSQVLDALNDGLETLRVDIVKTLDRPQDLTVNYEILETLKEGITDLRADMDKLTSGGLRPKTPQGGEIVLAEGAAVGDVRDIPANAASNSPGSNTRADSERMEVMLAQLQIKIEAMHQNLEALPMHQSSRSTEDGATKEGVSRLEDLLHVLQDRVDVFAAKEEPGPEGVARKEDTDAIETLLRNIRAQLEETVLSEAAKDVTKDNLDDIQAVVRITNDAMESVSDKLENSIASKADVAVVEVLVQDLKTTMEELGEKVQIAGDERPDVMTKADFDVLGVLCTDIKTRVHDMAFPEPDEMPSKVDIEQLQVLISEFRDSHDKLRDSYETDIAVTAKAFDDRKQEYEVTLAQISEVKVLLDDTKTELLDKLMDGELGLNTLGETIKTIEERTSNEGVVSAMKEMIEKVKEEFERAHETIEAAKVDHAASAESVLERQSEHKDDVISRLSEKLDSLFDGMMIKYDDAQLAAEDKAKAMEEQATQQRELFDSTRSMADDLKLSIDTLGTALTNFMGDMPATIDRMADESKTVFAQVEQTHSKLQETAEGLRGEHDVTRGEVARVLAAIDVVQSDMTEHNPRFMVTLEEVRALVNQHYEHSQRTSSAADDHAQAVRDLQDQLRAGFDAQKDGLRTHKEELQTVLPALMPPSAEVPASTEKYDDTIMHEKLDRLMGHVEEAATRSVQLDRLSQIHDKVMATAAEVSAFVSIQNKQITADHESNEKEAEQIALLLERRSERKDQLEADITVLNEEKEALQHAVEALKAEKDALMAQKARLNANVSSLETALHIRHDELHSMDQKAAIIEKRMMDGVMNQSRMLLLTKSSKSAPSRKKPQGRDLRVPSDASARSAQTVTSSLPALKTSHALAMKSRQAMQRTNGALPNTAERRIMSLSQINHNLPTGAHAFIADKPSLTATNLSNLKRSHSVKTHFMRKGSWAGKRNPSPTLYDKENQGTLSEREEDEEANGEGEETESPAGTQRRTSYFSTSDTNNTYATGSYLDGETPISEDGRRESYNQSEMTYDTGSYLTGSEVDQRMSMGSSANGVVGAQSPIAEQQEEEENAELTVANGRGPLRLEAPPSAMKHVYAPPSDSGIGTDLPTAVLSGGEEYFK